MSQVLEGFVEALRTSAKTGHNVSTAFSDLVRAIMKLDLEEYDREMLGEFHSWRKGSPVEYNRSFGPKASYLLGEGGFRGSSKKKSKERCC